MNHLSTYTKKLSSLASRRLARIFIGGVLGLIFLLAGNVAHANVENHQYPKVANVFLEWKLTRVQADALSKWDVVVLDMEVQNHSRDLMKRMRKKNPDIVILAYITSQEIRRDATTLQHSSPLRYKLNNSIHKDWWLTDQHGKQLSWWPGTRLLNVTNGAGNNNANQKWNDFLPQFVSDNILSNGLWDGIFYDNSWDNISYFMPNGTDLNRDGKLDTQRPHNDNQWRDGMVKIFQKTKHLHPDKIIVANGGHVYAPHVNGALYEHFDDDSFAHGLNKTKDVETKSLQPTVSILNSNVQNSGFLQDYRHMRFGLTSTLLTDGYYSFDNGDATHAEAWYYDEYDVVLGNPKSEAKKDFVEHNTISSGVWKREFANGVAIVNATASFKNIDLGGEFESIRGRQDPQHNNGRIVESIKLASNDGKILLRPLGEVKDVSYANGAFVRIYSTDGVKKRNGFFAYNQTILGGTQLLTTDLDGDGFDDVLTAENGLIKAFSHGTQLRGVMEPFIGYEGELSIAITDFNSDGTKDIVVGRVSGAPEYRIYERFGKEIGVVKRVPNVPRNIGINIAASESRIIIGTGKGAIPRVHVLDKNGSRIHSWIPYTRYFRGGVYVAVGNIDDDVSNEIITGTGIGGGPHVKIFSNTGTFKNEYFVGSIHNSRGVKVHLSDIDSDNKLELITLSNDVFTRASQ